MIRTISSFSFKWDFQFLPDNVERLLNAEQNEMRDDCTKNKSISRSD